MPESMTVRPTGSLLARTYLVQFALVVMTYFIAGRLGQATASIRSGNLGPVWPAYGIALAAILICGYRAWPAVLTGAFLVAFLSPVPPLTALGQASGATLAAVTGAFLLHRIVRFRPSLSRLSDVLGLIVFGGLGSAIISACIGVTALYITQERAYSGIGKAWLIYWLGDATGVLLVTPLALRIAELRTIRGDRRISEFLALLGLLCGVGLTVFRHPPSQEVRLDFLAFAVLPFVMWAAIRFGMAATALSTLLVATIATIATALGLGPFAISAPFVNAVLLDVFFFVVSVSGLTLAAGITERQNAELEREQMVRQQAALETRVRLATIVESSSDAIISQDLDGIVESWNSSAEHMFGFTEAEAIGRSISILIPPELEEEQRVILAKVREGERIAHLETVRVTKSGSRLDVSLTLSPIRNTVGQVVAASKIIRDITERKQAEQALLRMNQKLIEAQENERARIGRELHDDIAQRLALVVVELGRTQVEYSDLAPKLGTDLDMIRTHSLEVTKDVQSLSHQLHSAKLDYLGVAAAARAFCKELSDHQKVEIDFKSYDFPNRIPHDKSLCLYRVLQESLQNAVKHSGVRSFEVRLWGDKEDVHLTISDLGVGFERDEAMSGAGLGLTSMQERMKMVDGSFAIDSQPGRGTTIHASIPIDSEAEPARIAG